jgi:hypothetical protein
MPNDLERKPLPEIPELYRVAAEVTAEVLGADASASQGLVTVPAQEVLPPAKRDDAAPAGRHPAIIRGAGRAAGFAWDEFFPIRSYGSIEAMAKPRGSASSSSPKILWDCGFSRPLSTAIFVFPVTAILSFIVDVKRRGLADAIISFSQ